MFVTSRTDITMYLIIQQSQLNYILSKPTEPTIFTKLKEPKIFTKLTEPTLFINKQNQVNIYETCTTFCSRCYVAMPVQIIFSHSSSFYIIQLPLLLSILPPPPALWGCCGDPCNLVGPGAGSRRPHHSLGSRRWEGGGQVPVAQRPILPALSPIPPPILSSLHYYNMIQWFKSIPWCGSRLINIMQVYLLNVSIHVSSYCL
jgi:hypothetical protein